MEVVRDILAGRAIGIELHLAKPIGCAGGHRAVLARVQIYDIDAQTVCGVLQGHNQMIARVHKEILVGIRGEGRQGGLDRIGRSLRFAIVGDEGEVDRLDACDIETGSVIELPGDRVLRQAVDVERSAPFLRIAAGACWPGYPTRRIELHLHKGDARMVGADGGINDVAITVRRAGADLLGEGLGIAHRHAEPERWMQLEVERLVSRVCRCRISRKLEFVQHPVASARHIGVEERLRLVMTNVHILSENLLRVLDLGTKPRAGSAATVQVHVCVQGAFGGSLCWRR